jgi:predicted PurR-regulated permease PerM
MNGLSWLLYFAEVSENISGTLGVLSVISAIVFVVFWFLHILIPASEQSENFSEMAPKYAKTAAAVFGLCLLGLLFPSQNTVYLIIASESAEMVVTSESGQKMLGDIQQIVSLKLDTIAEDITGTATEAVTGNK